MRTFHFRVRNTPLVGSVYQKAKTGTDEKWHKGESKMEHLDTIVMGKTKRLDWRKGARAKKRSGPKTKASKGQRRHKQFTITIPAEIADKIASLMEAEHLTRSEVISILLEKALADY
jgi:hypothetical protein